MGKGVRGAVSTELGEFEKSTDASRANTVSTYSGSLSLGDRAPGHGGCLSKGLGTKRFSPPRLCLGTRGPWAGQAGPEAGQDQRGRGLSGPPTRSARWCAHRQWGRENSPGLSPCLREHLHPTVREPTCADCLAAALTDRECSIGRSYYQDCYCFEWLHKLP